MTESSMNYKPLNKPIAIKDQEWPQGTKPLVHTLTMTFNHEGFVAECIEGILMQKTTFPVQVLIHDDASQDNTASIVKKYEQEYPHIIRVYYQTENIYYKSKDIKLEKRKEFDSWRTCKYEAFCEGDDYWIDPLKLQKQVDFLERNLDYSLCVGSIKGLIEKTHELYDIDIDSLRRGKNPLGFTFDLEDVKNRWITKTLTAIYRFDVSIFNELKKYQYGRDTNMVYHYLKNGQKGFFFYDVLGVYRIHTGGIVSLQPLHKNLNGGNRVYKELYQKNRDEFTRYKLFYSTIDLLRYNLYHKYQENSAKKNINLFRNAISLANSLPELIKIFKSLLPKPKKRNKR